MVPSRKSRQLAGEGSIVLAPLDGRETAWLVGSLRTALVLWA